MYLSQSVGLSCIGGSLVCNSVYAVVLTACGYCTLCQSYQCLGCSDTTLLREAEDLGFWILWRGGQAHQTCGCVTVSATWLERHSVKCCTEHAALLPSWLWSQSVTVLSVVSDRS